MSSGITEIDLHAGISAAWWQGLVEGATSTVLTSEQLENWENTPWSKFEVVKEPLVEVNNGKPRKVEVYNHRGECKQLHKVIIGGHVIGVTTNDKPAVQLRELFDALDILWKEFGLRVVDMGSQWGRNVMTLSLQGSDDEFSVRRIDKKTKDLVQMILCVVTSFTGARQTQGFMTLNRVCCANTLRFAFQNLLEVIFKMKRTSQFSERLKEIKGAVDAWAAEKQAMIDRIQKLDSTPMDSVQFLPFSLGLIAGNDVSTTAYNRASRMANLASTGIGNQGKTRWDMLNGVTEYFDHYYGVKEELSNGTIVKIDKNPDARKTSAEWGTNAERKAQAFDVLLDDAALDELVANGMALLESEKGKKIVEKVSA